MTWPRDIFRRVENGRLRGLVQACQVVPAATVGGRVQASSSSSRNHEDKAS